MNASGRVEDLLRCAVQLIGRAALPEEKVQTAIGAGSKQLHAFNLADGTRSLTDIAKKAKLDVGNLSRTVDRWVKKCVAFWVGSENDKRLLHVYPIHGSFAADAPKRRKPQVRKRSKVT